MNLVFIKLHNQYILPVAVLVMKELILVLTYYHAQGYFTCKIYILPSNSHIISYDWVLLSVISESNKALIDAVYKQSCLFGVFVVVQPCIWRVLEVKYASCTCWQLDKHTDSCNEPPPPSGSLPVSLSFFHISSPFSSTSIFFLPLKQWKKCQPFFFLPPQSLRREGWVVCLSH